MSSSPKLPPSARDFLVYQRLVVDGASTRAVANEVHISQTRVRQIVLRVTQWLIETLPAADSQLSEAAQLRFGQHIAADRLERFYIVTNRAWEETSQTKFANLCIRIIAAQSKLPAMAGTLEALAADAILGPLPDDTSSLYASPAAPPSPSKSEICNLKSEIPSVPPVRACSPSPLPAPKAKPQPPAESTTTPLPEKPSATLPPTTRAARSAFFAPAHPSASTTVMPGSAHPVVRGTLDPAVVRGSPDPAPILELRITPEKLGFTTQKTLSRKDRRRLRRLALTNK